MAYHRQIREELSLRSEEELLLRLREMADRLGELPGADRRVLVKLQTIDWKTREPVPAAELARVAEPFRRFSICLAPADDPARVAALRATLRAGAEARR